MSADRPLEELQHHVRRLLAELDRVATAAGIPYHLAYGTALGAVREGDLIAWDPDADVWVASEHHPRLVAACSELLGPDFELLTAETHPDYEYLFPRLALRGTHHVLLSLDVFPLDHAPASARGRRLHLALARLLAQVLFVKRADTAVRVHYSRRKRWLTRALRVLAAPLPARVVVRVFRRLQRRRPTGWLVNSCGSYGTREVVDASWFEAAVATPLGPVPAGYGALLTSLYGDWQTPPDAGRRDREVAHALATYVAPLRRPGALLDPARDRSPA